jgi:hypothetical protein
MVRDEYSIIEWQRSSYRFRQRMEPLLIHDGVNPRALDSVRTNSFLEGSKVNDIHFMRFSYTDHAQRPKNEPPKSQKDKVSRLGHPECRKPKKRFVAGCEKAEQQRGGKAA